MMIMTKVEREDARGRLWWNLEQR